jgi:hypothetical protein
LRRPNGALRRDARGAGRLGAKLGRPLFAVLGARPRVDARARPPRSDAWQRETAGRAGLEGRELERCIHAVVPGLARYCDEAPAARLARPLEFADVMRTGVGAINPYTCALFLVSLTR